MKHRLPNSTSMIPVFLAFFVFLAAIDCACLTSPLQAMPQDEGNSAEAAQQESYTKSDLFNAAQSGDLELIKQLLKDGIDVNSKTRYNATALSFAADKGHLEIVKFLIENGADPSPQDTFYNATPLVWANMHGHKEIGKFLKENGGELPTMRADPERAKRRAADSSKKAEKEKDDEEAEEETFLEDSPESRMADRAFASPNWPQFRGTGARGIADGQNPPLKWDAEEGDNLLWKTAIDGLGHSCPVIYGDHIYITTAVSSAGDTSIKAGNYGDVASVEDDSEHSFEVICVNKNDGTVVWKQQAAKGVPKVKRHLKSTHANCTVATDGTHVMAFFAGEGLYCYSNEGELKWSKDLGKLDSGWFYDKSYQWGFGSSPIIFEGNVIVQCDIQGDSFVASYRLSDGEEVWKVERDEIPGWSSPTVVDSPRGPMLVTHATGFARGYDARTGEEWWRYGKHSEIVVPTPFVAHGLIYICSGYRPIQPIIAISLDAEGDITLPDNVSSSEHVAWYKGRGGTYMPSPLVYGDYMYLCSNDGVLTVLQATTGKQVYRTRLSKGLDQLEEDIEVNARMSFVGSSIAADGHIYFPAEDGMVFVIEAGPEFKMVAANRVDENVLTTPAITEGVFIVRGQNHLFAFSEDE